MVLFESARFIGLQAEVVAMLAQRQNVNSRQHTAGSAMERSRLLQELHLARLRHDHAEVEEIEARLKEMSSASANNGSEKQDVDLLAKVNERNRKANIEAVRKAEAAEADRRRRERKAALLGLRPSTPSDSSARLRTIPRLFENNSRYVDFGLLVCCMNGVHICLLFVSLEMERPVVRQCLLRQR